MYAIQLADLLVLHRDPIMRMILPPLMGKEEVNVANDQFDGVALPFACGDEQAAAMIEIIRKKHAHYQIRCYHKVNSAWKRV